MTAPALGGLPVFTVVVASQKGGAGKTTLARNLAAAAGVGAALIDTNPQGSLTDWWNRRQAEAPALARLDGDMAAGLAALAEGGMRLVLVDTPPSVHPWLSDLLRLADLVLIPVRPSPDDLAAVSGTLDLVEAAGRPFAFVVSQAKPGTILAREAVRRSPSTAGSRRSSSTTGWSSPPRPSRAGASRSGKAPAPKR